MKIDKYLEFINESKLQLILESTIVYSSNFLHILKLIDSPIAKILIEYYSKDEDIKRNYVDVNMDKEDVVTFLPQDKVDKEPAIIKSPDSIYTNMSKVATLKEYNNEFVEPSKNMSGKFIRVASLKELIELAPNQRAAWESKYSDDDPDKKILVVDYDMNGKQYRGYFEKEAISINLSKIPKTEISIGRFVRAFLTSLGKTIDNKELEDFVDKFKAVRNIAKNAFDRFKIVSGEDIRKYYSEDSYENENGDLGNSCMRYDKCQDFLDIYTDNPNVVQLIIYLSDNNKLLGRALLWTDARGRKIMDRIYTSKTPDIHLFIEYANLHKFYNKTKQDFDDTTPFTYNGTELNAPDGIKIVLKYGEYGAYPYMDTFKYFVPGVNFQGKWIGVLSNKYIDTALILTSTDGTYANEYDDEYYDEE